MVVRLVVLALIIVPVAALTALSQMRDLDDDDVASDGPISVDLPSEDEDEDEDSDDGGITGSQELVTGEFFCGYAGEEDSFSGARVSFSGTAGVISAATRVVRSTGFEEPEPEACQSIANVTELAAQAVGCTTAESFMTEPPFFLDFRFGFVCSGERNEVVGKMGEIMEEFYLAQF
jgi:hypothetical protein